MHILVEHSGHPLANLGDVAMLQIAIQRLRSLWPKAVFQVFTSAPERLANFCPGVQPLSLHSQNVWFYPLIGRLHTTLPKSVADSWMDWEWNLRQQYPSVIETLLGIKTRTNSKDHKAIQAFWAAIYRADLVIAAGGGYINDEFPELASSALGILGVANRLGKPTAMLGQGLGPLENPKLRAQAQLVLPKMNLITLREELTGKRLLNSLGVSPRMVITTGDDAIETAYNARRQQIGTAIGVNLRVAHYSGVDTQMIQVVRQAVQQVAGLHSAPLISIPISEYDSDEVTNQQLLQGFEFILKSQDRMDTPHKVIQKISQCRLVVTGSYHAGVFSLSQGIPVIGVVRSQYYINKFLGLAAQFGNTGCKVIILQSKQVIPELVESITSMWQAAESIKPQLLSKAEDQIEQGLRAYKSLNVLF